MSVEGHQRRFERAPAISETAIRLELGAKRDAGLQIAAHSRSWAARCPAILDSGMTGLIAILLVAHA